MDTNGRLDINWDNLFIQASRNSATYLEDAHSQLTELLGAGVVREHPELVVQVATNMSQDFMASMASYQAQNIADALAAIAVSLERDDPS